MVPLRNGLARPRHLIAVLLALATLLALGAFQFTPARAAAGEVVFLSTTDVGFGAGQLATSFVAAGKTVVYKTPAEWALMTAADFDDYDAIVLADPTCEGGGEAGAIAAAAANAAVWGSVVNGNVIVIGTDEQFHGTQGGQTLMNGAAAFVVADPAKTGAYVSLSCYYHGTAPGTPVAFLGAAFGGTWTMTGVGCFNDAHIVATHPAFTTAGVTDATLSGWSCSVHEAFDAWPVNFEVLAIARNIGSAFTAPDGTVGTPYIVARGVEVISDIDLSPETDVNTVGDTHTVDAVVTTDDPSPGTPVVGTTVTFTVIAGPHVGTTGNDVTDGTGTASFSYVGTTAGVDTIEATFVDARGLTQRSNRVTKEWVDAPADSVPPTATCVETNNPSGKNIPKAGLTAGKSGQNPDGFYVVGASDAESGVASIVLVDTASGATFALSDGDKIKLIQAPGVTPNIKPGAGDIDWQIQINGDAVLVVTDNAGNVTKVSCLVPPPPK